MRHITVFPPGAPSTFDDAIDEAYTNVEMPTMYKTLYNNCTAGERDWTSATVSRADGGPYAPGGLRVPTTGECHIGGCSLLGACSPDFRNVGTVGRESGFKDSHMSVLCELLLTTCSESRFESSSF